MKKIIIIAAIALGVWAYNQGKLSIPYSKPTTAGAFDESGDPIVWLFTTDNCAQACDAARKGLNKRGVDYEEKLINLSNIDHPDYKLWKKHAGNRFPYVVAGKQMGLGTSASSQASILGLAFGDKYLTYTESGLFQRHFYADGSPKVIMYGADWCPYCKKLGEDLNKQNIDFVAIDVEKHPNKKKISKAMEIYGYPATWVGYKRLNGVDIQAVKKTIASY